MINPNDANPWPDHIQALRGQDPVAQGTAFFALRRQLRRCLGALWAGLSDPDGLIDESITQIVLGRKAPSRGSTFTAAWFCTVVKNAAKDELRRIGIWRRKERLIVASEPEFAAPPEHEVIRKQIHDALQNLDPELRRVVELRYIEGMKLEEVAQQLGIAVSTAWKREKTAVLLLKDKLS